MVLFIWNSAISFRNKGWRIWWWQNFWIQRCSSSWVTPDPEAVPGTPPSCPLRWVTVCVVGGEVGGVGEEIGVAEEEETGAVGGEEEEAVEGMWSGWSVFVVQ